MEHHFKSISEWVYFKQWVRETLCLTSYVPIQKDQHSRKFSGVASRVSYERPASSGHTLKGSLQLELT